MRLLILFMVAGLLHVSATTLSQTVTIRGKSMPLAEIFNEIRRQTGIGVYGFQSMFEGTRAVTVEALNEPIAEFIKTILVNQPLEADIKDNVIVIKRKTTPVLMPNRAASPIIVQQREITGKIVDAQGTPLVGVTVSVLGTSTSVTTNDAGDYRIGVTSEGSVLVFTNVGYEREERPIRSETVIDLAMRSSVSGLEEVVVVAYGTQRKETITGAISSIQTKEIKQSPAANLSVTLAGRLPGLASLQRTGEPGKSAIDLYIRGRSTVNVQRPLVIVDGIEREIDVLDPNEIETVSILKDASATAIFGVRGANGVILITTKRGVPGSSEINYSSEFGFTNFTRFPDATNAFDYATLVNEAAFNDVLNRGGDPNLFTPVYSDEALAHYRNRDYLEVYPDHDWYREFTVKMAPQNRHNLNVSGGTEKVRYFINGGFLRHAGQYKTDQTEWEANTWLNRYNFRSNIDVQLTKTLTASLSASGYLEKTNSPSGTLGASASAPIIINAMQVVPANAFNNTTPDGEVLAANSYPGGIPVYGAINRSGYHSNNRNQVNASLSMQQKLDFITQGLDAKVMFSYDSEGLNSQRRDRSYAIYQLLVNKEPDGSDALSYVPLKDLNSPLGNAQSTYYETHENLQFSINYRRSFRDTHHLSGLLLYTQDKRVVQIDLPFNLVGYVGRATYNYNGKYFGEFNFGYNGSEQFAKGQRFGFFPSVSAGWMVSEESFFKSNIHAVDQLKIRGSYGIVGNDQFNAIRFLYLDNYQSVGGGLIGGSLGGNQISEILIGNKDLTWETAKKANLGIDIAFLRSWGLTVDLFKESRDNILINRGTIPEVIGTGSLAPVNFGLIENKGFEVELSYQKQLNNNWGVYFKTNMSYAENEFMFADEPLLADNYAVRTRQTGFPLGQPFGLQTAGFFTTDDEVADWADQSSLNNGRPVSAGDLKYIDTNLDGVINNADYVPIGYPNVPLMTMGASLSISYKNVDLSVLLQGVGMVTQTIRGGAVDGTENFFTFHLDRFNQQRYDNDESIRFPRLLFESYANKQPSDFYTQRADFLRLKNAEIGFTLPTRWSNKFGSSRARIYANGLNLFLLYDRTKFKMWDPETAEGNGAQYPINRVINFGVNIIF